MERTLIVLKPDAVQRQLVGTILERFEKRGLRITAMKLMQVDRPLAEKHYAVHAGKFFYEGLVNYITSGPVAVMVLEGVEAIGVVRKMIGKTRPHEAEPGTIRGDFALTGLRNLVHASDAIETAQAEIALYFRDEEIVNYSRDVDRWIYED
ncbi:MAG TPA: nucleoside-diphosphate kinase [Chloroflexota bacterium]|nr:nucleoside-diphosphate kinase [Chloroflexota bacterium]